MRRRLVVEGTVQGVGFRPHAARLARALGLGGHVRNDAGAVVVEVEGADVAAFERRLVAEAPPAARVERVRGEDVPDRGERTFHIDDSRTGGAARLTLPPDLAVCGACLAEVDAPGRRHAYPFTNCTDCGPRFTITRALPYDRARTTMEAFALCADCAREYGDPADRRFHAEPIACPACGPSLTLLDGGGAVLARRDAALGGAVEALRRGLVVALKGVGGFQWLVDATDEAAVTRLRARKGRPHQPFAVMVARLEDVPARLDEAERAALTSPAGPIVLVRATPGRLAPSVAPGNPRVGAFLPTTPLHHLLLRRLGRPVVATSGNLHGEPLAIDAAEARGVADVCLTHDRPIAHRCDDAVVQVAHGRTRVLRAGRGLAPLALPLEFTARAPVLGVGAHLKNAPALITGDRAVLWPHVGDLHSPRARAAFSNAIEGLQAFLDVVPARVATDRHPDYASSLWAAGRPCVAVQHHHAHVAACLAEHGVDAARGLAWDGVGLGDDGALWGGEVLDVSPAGYRRVAALRPFPLPGGDAAARDGTRALAGLCVAAGIEAPAAARRHEAVARTRLAAPTTSVGRLFDAVAALTGLLERSTFEGQAAMAVEAAATPGAAPYPFGAADGELDWRPMLAAMLGERGDAARVASRFHATLVEMAVAAVAGAPVVALSGGCFQNRLLLEGVAGALEARGVRVLVPERVPPGDGGLSLGQAWVAARRDV